MDRLFVDRAQSPIGELTAVIASREGVEALCVLAYPVVPRISREVRQVEAYAGVESERTPAALHALLWSQLDQYFAGERRTFDIPLWTPGTEFQRGVWRELLTIPFGRTVSYADVARAIGRPGAQRAVGAANGANRVSIIVPCHRVIESTGGLRGYGGGLDRKRWLLDHEQGPLALPGLRRGTAEPVPIP